MQLPPEEVSTAGNISGQQTSGPWSRISLGPPDSWVADATYDSSISARDGWHTTHLLWMRQVHAEVGASFHAAAIRLETPLAVQHQSQWKLNFDARTQTIRFHWLRVVRDGKAKDHLNLAGIRLIQRETELDRQIITGNWTLLVVLDDVRPGDVIEAAYTVTTRHPILLEGCEILFVVPPQAVVGRYYLSVLFPGSQKEVNWLGSADAPQRRDEAADQNAQRWIWEGSQLTPREPENNAPASFLDFTWVQVSSLTGWAQLSTRVRQVWDQTLDGSDLIEASGFTKPEVVDEAAIDALIESVQDGFRYLSVELEPGGWVPVNPAEVARRHYGDCKDLAWMTASILKQWGVEAEVVLVGTGLRETITQFLPATFLFNHAVLSVKLNGAQRWYDLTLRRQGGDFASRPIARFGHGLLVVADSSALIDQPPLPETNLYAVREIFYIDTRRGHATTIEQCVWAEGWNADNLRQHRLNQGAQEFANDRLKWMRQRFRSVQRVGTLNWRDDRKRNVCEIVDVFDISDAVYADEKGQRALFDVGHNLMLQTLAIPEDKPRRGPWALPFPLELRHQITIKTSAAGAGQHQRRRWSEPEFIATQDEPRHHGVWTKTMHVKVLAPQVQPSRIDAFRQRLTAFLDATTWRIYLPWNLAKSERGKDFGELPPAGALADDYVPVADPKTFPDAATTVAGTPPAPPVVQGKDSTRKVVSIVIAIFLLLNALRACSDLPR